MVTTGGGPPANHGATELVTACHRKVRTASPSAVLAQASEQPGGTTFVYIGAG